MCDVKILDMSCAVLSLPLGVIDWYLIIPGPFFLTLINGLFMFLRPPLANMKNGMCGSSLELGNISQ